MPTISRLKGRFFAVLPFLILAITLPATAAGGVAPKNQSDPAPTLCQITDTVYRADGTPAQGTALISWPAFTTAAGQAVTPGSLTVTLDTGGGFNASLAPNTGASPAGTYYRAVFKLNDGTTDAEYWVVPNAATTTIGAIRSKLVPSSQAAQFLTRDFADSTYVALASTQTITGVKTFANSPAVPTPQNATDAANKSYVDANVGAGNLASPPPIGNVTPNSGTFTTLNNVPNAAAFAGSDPCAKINAAVATLSSQGGTVDARGFTATQLSTPCATTMQLNVPMLTLLLPAGTLTVAGNPGINLGAGKVVIECPAGGEGDLYNTFPATLKSGGAYPLISNTVPGLHNTDGITIRNCYLDGDGKGTFGFFFPYGNSGHLENVYTRNFTSVGQFILGGQWTAWASSSGGNSGDGLVWGFDGSVNGNPQFAGNQGTAVHVVSGGNDLNGVGTYKNRLHGIYIDGTGAADWKVSTTYIQQSFIRPISGNPGNFVYFTQVAGVTGTSRPSFCQTPGCTFTDGTVTWINAGTAYAYTAGSSIFSSNYWNFIKSANSTSNGYQAPAGFDADDIRIEGTASSYSVENSILSAKVRQSEANDSPAHGIHLKWASTTAIHDEQWLGGGFSGNVDLGGLRIENSFDTNVDGIDCYNSYSNCVQVAGSQKTVLNNFIAENDGLASTPVAQTFALSVDSGSAQVLVKDMYVEDNRSTSYSRGVSNAGANLVVKNQRYNSLAGNFDSGSYSNEFASTSGTFFYNVPSGAGYLWSMNGSAAVGFNSNGIAWYSGSNSVTVDAPTSSFAPYQLTWPTTAGASGQCLTSVGGGATPMTWGPCSTNLSSPPPIGNTTPNTINATALTFQNIPGVEFLVSRYATIQAAINAAYNGGTVLGTVVDDRTSPYAGPGFILYDSVTLKLAATTYTINGVVTYNNGNNVVTAGIVALPGARLIGASTSSNHGTIITAANGLNTDLIATSSVGTGIGASAQWWHWGGFENLRVTGNGANQTAGNCFNIENMGEVAFLRTIEVSGCYLDNILFTGASATPSDIANITTNSAGRYGFNFNNLSGVAVVHGLSGDSNTTSIVRLNGGQSGTLTIVGFKTEEEISGQDPLITIDQTGQSGAQPSLYIVGGYTFGRSGVNDVIKYVNGTVGTTPYISVNNFYVQNYVNAVTDVVNGRATAAANMNKVPFYYGPTGGFLSGQAFTLDLNTFIQSPHSGNGILTEVFGTTSSNETIVAGSGTSTSVSTGGIGFRMPNRTTFGQTPDLFAKMTYAFPGGVPNTQEWEFIPVKVSGDNSTRWVGDPSYRWDEVYATDVNATTATVGALNVTTCNGCGTGTRLVSGTMQGTTSTLVGNSADQTIYTATLPAGTFAAGAGVHCYAKWTHPTASGAVTYKWTLGTTTWAYGAYTSASLNLASDIEVLTISSLSAQAVNLSPVIAGTTIGIGGSYGNAGSENLGNTDTIKLTFNGGASDQVKGATFYCQTVQ